MSKKRNQRNCGYIFSEAIEQRETPIITNRNPLTNRKRMRAQGVPVSPSLQNETWLQKFLRTRMIKSFQRVGVRGLLVC